ncbi:MAG: hypothetical protein LBH43_15155 [Treponema sp.]|jgi:hypothetical protein|nr:hypothetical protein [Treponema sp.]
MKKISLLLVIFAIISVSLFAQTEKNPEIKPVSGDIEALQIANTLARYGYTAKSPSALIGAAEILVRIKTQAIGDPKERSQTATATTPEFTPANLLADARKMAGRDRTMTAWADDVDKLLKAGTRGAAGGPKVGRDIAPPGGTVTFTVVFRANELAEVLLVGDGSTILDIFIYDPNGNLVVYTDVSTYDAYLNWVPRVTGSFDIVVKNWGNRSNRFQINTN